MLFQSAPTETNATQTLLEAVRDGHIAPDEAARQLRAMSVEHLDFATLDHHRAQRQGFPEVIYGAGKTPDQIAQIAQSLHARGQVVLATRCTRAAFDATQQVLATAQWDEIARLITVPASTPENAPQLSGMVGVIAAGTSDLPVAREASGTLHAMGAQTLVINDIGVAGLHRMLGRLDEIRACDVVIAVAGMEGALPSVLGGLLRAPLIAVPTSVGYGANFGGLSALLGMLNSCASGIAVVNIDNGFGAAMCAAKILQSRVDTSK